jgi:hypothetical protein
VRLSGISDSPTAGDRRRLLHLIARRGDSHDFPENTLAALRSALALGARFIEIDVHLLADGTPMVVRDEALPRKSGTHIPTLDAVLGLLEGRPEITVFVMQGVRACCASEIRSAAAGVRVLRSILSARERTTVARSVALGDHGSGVTRSRAGSRAAWRRLGRMQGCEGLGRGDACAQRYGSEAVVSGSGGASGSRPNSIRIFRSIHVGPTSWSRNPQ